jgi:hypothetical protein
MNAVQISNDRSGVRRALGFRKVARGIYAAESEADDVETARFVAAAGLALPEYQIIQKALVAPGSKFMGVMDAYQKAHEHDDDSCGEKTAWFWIAGRGLEMGLEDVHAIDPATGDLAPYHFWENARNVKVYVGEYQRMFEIVPSAPFGKGVRFHLSAATDPKTVDKAPFMVGVDLNRIAVRSRRT